MKNDPLINEWKHHYRQDWLYCGGAGVIFNIVTRRSNAQFVYDISHTYCVPQICCISNAIVEEAQIKHICASSDVCDAAFAFVVSYST